MKKEKTTATIRELAEKPVYYGQKGRDLIWYYRHVSAFNMARIKDGEAVSVEEYNKALDLLLSCVRYALADARHWEYENSSERYCNSQQCKDDGAKLDRRRERLQKMLAEYGLFMENYGLYPTICDIDTKERTRHTIGLYYFD